MGQITICTQTDLKIYTTINSKMQQYAEEAVHTYICHRLQDDFFTHWKGYS